MVVAFVVKETKSSFEQGRRCWEFEDSGLNQDLTGFNQDCCLP